MLYASERYQSAVISGAVSANEILVAAYHRRRYQRAVKRIFDITVAVALLATLVPVFLIVALWIRLDSPGPVFFNRQRVGRNGKPFVMYKLRSMIQDAEQRLTSLQHLNTAGQRAIKIPNDPRVTKTGQILRKTSLDELPQLLNVLKGEMSLIGPRPQAANEVALYTERERRRLEAIPGMTGLWQVTARHDSSFAAWVKWDLAYLENWSLLLDLQILCRTIAVLWSDCRSPRAHSPCQPSAPAAPSRASAPLESAASSPRPTISPAASCLPRQRISHFSSHTSVSR